MVKKGSFEGSIDNVSENGVYYVFNSTNGVPFDGFLIHVEFSNNLKLQVLFPKLIGTYEIENRVKWYNDNWSNWD